MTDARRDDVAVGDPGDRSPSDGSPMDVFEPTSSERRWPRVLAISAAVLLVVAGLYVGGLWAWRDTVPRGTTVAGVDVGGLSADAAQARLTESLAPATTEPIPVVAGDRRTTLDPAVAGLELDIAATLDGLTGFDLSPVRLWEHVVGAGQVDPVTSVDRDALAAAVDTVAEALTTPPVDGTVVLVDGEAVATPAAPGSQVDSDAAQDALATGWLTAPRPLELPTAVVEPAIDQAEVDRVLAEVARPLADAPITVSVGDQLAELPVDVVTAAASFVPDGERLELELDGEQLVTAVLERNTGLLTEPSDAGFEFGASGPVVVEGVPGTTIDPEQLADAVASAGTSDDRTARVDLVETEPESSTADLEALGITEIVSEFSTPLTSEPRRTGNIVNGASKINGWLLRPDEVFSLTEALVPIDAANGYVQAGAIVNGEHVDAWGGGLSQVATTVYNAAFFAGFEDVEHHPHSEWFRRYPEGREATIYTGSLDLQFRNNTPYGALIQSWVDDGQLHVRVWGTEHFDVETTTSGRSDVVEPRRVYSQSPTCEPQEAGNPGFRVTVTRQTLLDGEVYDEESWTVRYRPQNQVICGPAPGEDAG